jgi:metal-responsive CopG/Arc/MetJ family transcriptional regulator
MVKKVIQVPVDRELLNCLDRVSKKQQRARAELIREACMSYLSKLENDEMDKIYRSGYEKMPEKEDTGRAQVALTDSILEEERW